MAFKLVVEFSGLCLYLIHSDGNRVGVAMPDGRVKNLNVKDYQDGCPETPHVGYLSHNLDDTRTVAHPLTKAPESEVIHRFDFETLDFGLGAAQPITVKTLDVPDLKDFTTTDVAFRKGLLPGKAGGDLLMFTALNGGTLEGKATKDEWSISSVLNPGTPAHAGSFGGTITWERDVPAMSLTLTLKAFAPSVKETKIVLAPADNSTVYLKIANLCSDNPMEWDELGIRSFPRQIGAFDNDFKWIYNLLEHSKYTFEQLTRNFGLPLPAPELRKIAAGQIDDCTGLKVTSDF